PRTQENFIVERFPFCDNQFMNLVISIPARLRAHSHIYKKMLAKAFPAYYETIPWENTGTIITRPFWRVQLAGYISLTAARFRRALRAVGLSATDGRAMTDYASWIRNEPTRSQFTRIIAADDAIYPQYLSADEGRRFLKEHLSGQDRSVELCLYATIE